MLRVFPGPSLVKQRSTHAASVVHLQLVTAVVDSKTPHLPFSAGGACHTAPESGDDGRTLGSTPSTASSCTDHLSRLPVRRCQPLPELHIDKPSDDGEAISHVAEPCRDSRLTDSNRCCTHVAPERAFARAPADGAMA